MECQVLYALSFEISLSTTSKSWSDRYLATMMAAGGEPSEERSSDNSVEPMRIVCWLSDYLCELALYKTPRFAPSVVAAAAVCLARHTLALEPFSLALQDASGLSLAHSEVRSCIAHLHCLQRLEGVPGDQLSAVFTKFARYDVGCVARLQPPAALPA